MTGRTVTILGETVELSNTERLFQLKREETEVMNLAADMRDLMSDEEICELIEEGLIEYI